MPDATIGITAWLTGRIVALVIVFFAGFLLGMLWQEYHNHDHDHDNNQRKDE